VKVGGYTAGRRPLSPRMQDVLRCGARGYTAAQTAEELGVTVSTVRTERAATYARLGVTNMAAACMAAVRRGEFR
jgi:DNA-binding NarL/FixJ family response regulator